MKVSTWKQKKKNTKKAAIKGRFTYLQKKKKSKEAKIITSDMNIWTKNTDRKNKRYMVKKQREVEKAEKLINEKIKPKNNFFRTK